MKIIESAKTLIEEGSYVEAYEMLAPLIEMEDPEALYLYSSFGIDDSESVEQFEKRSLQLIRRAADLGLPDALYTLGVIYESGDASKVTSKWHRRYTWRPRSGGIRGQNLGKR